MMAKSVLALIGALSLVVAGVLRQIPNAARCYFLEPSTARDCLL